jgi:hypothetical protein
VVKKSLQVISAILICIATAEVAALQPQQTWTGLISDSMCKLHHESGAEGQTTTDPDCTRDCVKGGSKYVLVVGETAHLIANQDHRQLAEYAGMRVVVTGTAKEDAIEVSKIETAR